MVVNNRSIEYLAKYNIKKGNQYRYCDTDILIGVTDVTHDFNSENIVISTRFWGRSSQKMYQQSTYLETFIELIKNGTLREVRETNEIY